MSEVLGAIVLAIAGVALYAVIIAVPVMLLWNWLMPELFGLATLNFWKALGVAVLSSCLFGHNSNSKSD